MSSLMRNGLMRNRLTPNNVISNNISFPVIRRLGADDLKCCAALSVDRGWWPERAKWSLLLAASEAYGVDAPDGQGLAGTVVLTRWGADCAAIGMMLVASRYGGRGLGRALMEHALRAGTPGSSGNVRVATEADLPAIIAQDRVKYGADRERMLARLPGFADRMVVFEASEGIVGYAAAWRTEAFMMIGPLVAPDGAAARRLVTDLAVHSPVAVRLDLDPDRPELPNWARACGLAPTERTVLMTRGDLAPRGTPEHVYTPYSVACA